MYSVCVLHGIRICLSNVFPAISCTLRNVYIPMNLPSVQQRRGCRSVGQSTASFMSKVGAFGQLARVPRATFETHADLDISAVAYERI